MSTDAALLQLEADLVSAPKPGWLADTLERTGLVAVSRSDLWMTLEEIRRLRAALSTKGFTP